MICSSVIVSAVSILLFWVKARCKVSCTTEVSEGFEYAVTCDGYPIFFWSVDSKVAISNLRLDQITDLLSVFVIRQPRKHPVPAARLVVPLVE